ncbi:hypothetical protein [Sphingobium sp. LB126]|uniref:hypothetical protein n=1 Tax=Sphingobium sp. LB126 TaxID=1983755 RepID=UPI0018D57F5E|nr:hypothetical protein [Sphingobium sp. LB126]
MTTRTTRKSMTFSAPFHLLGFEAPLPAGTYVVETDEEAFEGYVHTAFRRTAASLRIRTGPTIEHHQVDPLHLEAAWQRDQDAARSGLVPAGSTTTRADPAR